MCLGEISLVFIPTSGSFINFGTVLSLLILSQLLCLKDGLQGTTWELVNDTYQIRIPWESVLNKFLAESSAY